MHVILTCQYSPWSTYSGGGQRSTFNLATALADRGHRVQVVYTKAPMERVEVPRDLPFEVYWAALPWHKSVRAIPTRAWTGLSVAHRVRSLLPRNRDEPVIVHGQGEEAAAVAALRRGRSLGVVVTPRFPSLPDALLARPPKLAALAKLGLFDQKYLALGVALRMADFVSPPSHYGGDLMQRAYRLRGDQVEPVHNGVPKEFLEYSWRGNKDGPGVFFGRLDDSKGVDTLIEAVAALGRDAPAKIRIFGRGPKRDVYAQQIAARGLGERFEFCGWADHHALGRALSEASFAVLPSREENFSLAVLSALAVGVPLVTTRVGGTEEVVEHHHNGWLFDAGNARGLEAALREVYPLRDHVAQIAASGRARVRADFTWDVTAAKFEQLYARTPRK